MSQLFISHSSRDNAEAKALDGWLRREGWVDIFLDFDPERGIAAGERWERTLNQAANRCEAVLFLVSRHWLGSGWCQKEFGLAHRLNKRLFGILIDDTPIADLPPNLTASWQLVDLAAGRDHDILRVALPVTHAEAHVSFSREGLRRLGSGLKRAGLDPAFFAWPPPEEPRRAPYPGLRPLEAQDAGIFFGREAQIVEALDRMRALREAAAPRLLCILGASGSGKSSFLRAGMWPRLARDDRAFLPLPVLRPERAALSGPSGLEASLDSACGTLGLPESRAEIRAAIRSGAATLRPLLLRLVASASARLVGEEAPPSPEGQQDSLVSQDGGHVPSPLRGRWPERRRSRAGGPDGGGSKETRRSNLLDAPHPQPLPARGRGGASLQSAGQPTRRVRIVVPQRSMGAPPARPSWSSPSIRPKSCSDRRGGRRPTRFSPFWATSSSRTNRRSRS